MATEGRATDTSLAKVLFEEPYHFDFFQVVRLLERTYPKRRPVGYEGPPSDELVRFRARPSLEFPPSEVYELTRDGAGGEDYPLEMTVAFMGLTGPEGVLPTPYTELLIERVRHKDTALRDFLDLFNHRLISLFYRAWEKYRFAVAYERGGEDSFTKRLFDIIGLGTGGLRNRLSFPDEALLLYGGLVAQRPHSASALKTILVDYFQVPVDVEQFSGQWLELDEESLTRVGSANCELGISSIAGKRVWGRQSKFRLKLGPLSFKQFTTFLPVGAAFKPATELTRLLVGMELDFDVQLILKAHEVPPCLLDTRGESRPLLGWTTWLKTREFIQDDPQLILSARI